MLRKNNPGNSSSQEKWTGNYKRNGHPDHSGTHWKSKISGLETPDINPVYNYTNY